MAPPIIQSNSRPPILRSLWLRLRVGMDISSALVLDSPYHHHAYSDVIPIKPASDIKTHLLKDCFLTDAASIKENELL